MDRLRKRNSVAMVLLMVMSLFAGLGAPIASASEVVMTDAIEVTPDGAFSDRMVSIDADSQGNVHFIWSRNTQHLYYKMLDARGEVLIDDTKISNAGAHRAWHPDVRVDHDDMVHVTWTDKAGQWTIMYTLLDPSLDDQNGDETTDSAITIVNDFEVSSHPQNRDWPAIDIDSDNDPHIVWQDSYEPLDKFYQQPQIYYAMLDADVVSRTVEFAVGETLLTPIIGHKGHPDIAIDLDDFVQVVWDDTRGGKVEMVIPIDTSGSMLAEWADMCVVFYGGNFVSGSYFQGLKPLLVRANMTVYETLYGIGGHTSVSAATSGNCATAFATGGSGSQGPRNTALGLVPGDDSGGIRKLNGVIMNGGALTINYDGGGVGSESWGPSSTWACLSWKDAQGNVPGNPPTQLDHKWNPNATKIVIPVSDEPPYDGTSWDSQDTNTILEAHDACVNAGVIPTPLWAQSNEDVGSSMKDLAQCPNGIVSSSSSRNCPGTSVRLTNAGGQMYSFPTGASSAAELQLMVEALVYLATNNSREIFMTVLDPKSLLDSPHPGWQKGDPGTVVDTQADTYTEDLGPSLDSLGYGHLVVVNDTRITLNDAFSLHPSIAVDTSGNTHVAWMDGRAYGFEIDVNYEVYYTRLKLQGVADWDGVEEGLPSFGIKQITDSAISNVEGLGGIDSNRPYGANSHMPSILTDDFDNVHLSWLDNSNESQMETVMYARLNHTHNSHPDGFPLNSLATSVLDEWEVIPVTSWSSNKLGPNSPASPDLGQAPAFANDLGSGAHISWSDDHKCSDENNGGKFTICYVHVLTGLVDIGLAETETYYHTIQPSGQTTFNLTISNPTPGPPDLVSDTFFVSMEGVPNNWSSTLFFATNHTPIFPSTPIFLEGGEIEPIYMRIRSPTIYQADEDELATIVLTALSEKDPAIRDEQITLVLMDVVHGIQLDTSHYQADVEQGQNAVFSISITNTGNVYDTFAFYDPTTLEGQTEWALPFGWGISFPTSLSLDPSQSVTRNLQVSVPTSQEPGTFVIYLKGWSTGEPVLSVDRGTFDILELWVNVSVRTTGNIVFQLGETTQHVLPGECSTFDVDVTKHFTPGHLIFSTPGGPDERPSEISENTWRYDNWVVDLDFSNAPGGNGIPDNAPRYWSQIGIPQTVTALMCAPYNATAGLGTSVSFRAYLEGAPQVSDNVVLLTNVIQVYDLEASVPDTILSLHPGQQYEMPTTIDNIGNGPDRYDMAIQSITDSEGYTHVWDIDIPRVLFDELDRDESQEIPITISVPEKTLAGQYTIVLEVMSEEEYDGTRIRDLITLQVEIIEFHDMRIVLDPLVESKIKTTAPGRTVRFVMNVTNFGNVPDIPTLHNHTIDAAGEWDLQPGMNQLDKWQIRFALLEGFDSEFPIEKNCIELTMNDPIPADECYVSATTNSLTLPEMQAYTTLNIVAIIDIHPEATLADREIGIKVMSDFGSSEADGDYDETPSWEDSCTLDLNGDGLPDNYSPNCDTNEQIVELRLRAPDLEIYSVSVDEKRGSVGDMLSVNVQVRNIGNAHATDVNIVLCSGQSESDIKKNGCKEENIAYRQTIEAIMPSEDPDPPIITLLYMVEAGSHDIVVVLDPDNSVVETDEDNNVLAVNGKMGSDLGILDVGVEAIVQYSVPAIILGATFALFGVVGVVMYGRRMEALQRYQEKSSLLANLSDDDITF